MTGAAITLAASDGLSWPPAQGPRKNAATDDLDVAMESEAVNPTFLQWLVMAMLIFAPLGVAALVVRHSAGPAGLDRRDFAIRVLGLFLAAILAQILLPGDFGFALSAPLALGSLVMNPYWAMGRLRDMGAQQKYRAILVAVPIFGPFFLIYLMLARPAPRPGRAD